jgi:hypothetical protein
MSLARKLKRKDVIPQATARKLYAQGQLKGVQTMTRETEERLSKAYDRGKEAGFEEASMKAQIYMIIFGIAVLHDEFGFGKDRAKRFAEKLQELTRAVNAGEVKTTEIVEALAKENGMAFLMKSEVDDGDGNTHVVDWQELIDAQKEAVSC